MIAQVEALLGAFTYKPGWTFSLVEAGYEQYLLNMEAPPFTLKGRDIGVCDHNCILLPRYYAELEMNASDLMNWLHHEVTKFEIHISNECFRIDGIAPFATDHT